ncbi:hypothetical protein EKO27_g1324 [Xylaria grammica]|uniref:Uncharacterized protein n=1 Tax=Xylaria grammica TaxID=363999 RepID=A0A439DHD3_9PEZI|nr:hypothetical protein EKO27_g1324 [Xylaria grammica]
MFSTMLAQAHYTEAEVLIVAEEWKVAEKAKSLSWASTTSLGSPGLSVASRTPESNSTLSSPRTSIFFLDDEASAKPARLIRVKSKKKVSFSSLPEFFEFQPEPHIRPDSPTLGWDEHALILPHEVEAPFPMLPKKQSPTSIIKSPIEEKTSPGQIMISTEVESRTTRKTGARRTTPSTLQLANRNTAAAQEYSRERSSTPSNHTFDLESFLHTRTLNRFREQLLALRGQVCHHRAAVDELLTTPNDTQTPTKTTKPTSELDMFPKTQQPHVPYTISHVRHQSTPSPIGQVNNSSRPVLRLQTDIRNDASGKFHRLRGYGLASASPSRARCSTPIYAHSPATPTSTLPSPLSARCDEENLRDRIERLRASGWQRKRFDGRRYEALREQVLGELQLCC